jgi:hypothetical protein
VRYLSGKFTKGRVEDCRGLTQAPRKEIVYMESAAIHH